VDDVEVKDVSVADVESCEADVVVPVSDDDGDPVGELDIESNVVLANIVSVESTDVGYTFEQADIVVVLVKIVLEVSSTPEQVSVLTVPVEYVTQLAVAVDVKVTDVEVTVKAIASGQSVPTKQ
jgi:hypothetical protein